MYRSSIVAASKLGGIARFSYIVKGTIQENETSIQKKVYSLSVSRNGPRPREQYGYLFAGEILCNYDVIISDGNLVGTRRLGDSRGTSPGFAEWHVSGVQTVRAT
jgi:hypothetical protein